MSNLKINFTNNNLAYSLMELAIVITIIAITSIISFTLYEGLNKKNQYQKIAHKLDVIETALLKYYKRNLKLPPPDSLLNDKIIDNICNLTNSLKSKKLFFHKNIIIGSVPTIHLNLTYDYKFDNFGNNILYGVNKNFVCNKTYYGDSNLIITDIKDKIITNNAIYVILSLDEYYHTADPNNFDIKNNQVRIENSDMDNIFTYSLINSEIYHNEQIRFKDKSLFFIDLAFEKTLMQNININSYFADLSCKCSYYSHNNKVNEVVKNLCIE